MPSSTSPVVFENVSSTSVRATLPAMRTFTECDASTTAPSRSCFAPGFFALSCPRPRTSIASSGFSTADSLHASASPSAGALSTHGGAPVMSRPSSPARTSTLCPLSSTRSTTPRLTSTDVSSCPTVTASFVPRTVTQPCGTSKRAVCPSTCATSATIAPWDRRARRPFAASSASSVARSSVSLVPSAIATATRVRPSVRSSLPAGTAAPFANGAQLLPSPSHSSRPLLPPSTLATLSTVPLHACAATSAPEWCLLRTTSATAAAAASPDTATPSHTFFMERARAGPAGAAPCGETRVAPWLSSWVSVRRGTGPGTSAVATRAGSGSVLGPLSSCAGSGWVCGASSSRVAAGTCGASSSRVAAGARGASASCAGSGWVSGASSCDRADSTNGAGSGWVLGPASIRLLSGAGGSSPRASRAARTRASRSAGAT